MHALVAHLRSARQASTLRRLARGFALPFRAARFLRRHRVLWPWAVAPMLINAALFAGLVGAVVLYADVAWARYGLGWRRKLQLLRTHGALAGGFGLGTSLLLWIPVLSVLLMPVAVVGGTALALALLDEAPGFRTPPPGP